MKLVSMIVALSVTVIQTGVFLLSWKWFIVTTGVLLFGIAKLVAEAEE